MAAIVTFESDWKPPLGDGLKNLLSESDDYSRLDIGCVASRGIFCQRERKVLVTEKKPATAFLLELIARLQELATVPMIDVRVRSLARQITGTSQAEYFSDMPAPAAFIGESPAA